MGRTITVDEINSVEEVTRIQWVNVDGEVEHIVKDSTAIDIVDSGNNEARIYLKDIPKLSKALEVAMENGWHND